MPTAGPGALAPAPTLATRNEAMLLVVCPSIDARLFEGDATSLDLFDDLVSRLRPLERLGVGVAEGDVVLDGGDELGDAGEAATLEPLGGQLSEPPLDQVEPRRAGGREVEVEAGCLASQAMTLGCLWVP